MALDDFLGNYSVRRTADIDFGPGTTITVSKRKGDKVKVVFENPLYRRKLRYRGEYCRRYDALRIEWTKPDQLMWISRFPPQHPAIYGIVLDRDAPRHTPVWSAERKLKGRRRSGPPVPVPDPVGRYKVKTTTDVPFGTGSRIWITETGPETWKMKVYDAVCDLEVLDMRLVFDQESGTFFGHLPSPEYRISLSLTTRPGEERRFIYGMALKGDPEQGGTFGGEEDPEIPPYPPKE